MRNISVNIFHLGNETRSTELWGNVVEREDTGKPSTIMKYNIIIILLEYIAVMCNGLSCPRWSEMVFEAYIFVMTLQFSNARNLSGL